MKQEVTTIKRTRKGMRNIRALEKEAVISISALADEISPENSRIFLGDLSSCVVREDNKIHKHLPSAIGTTDMVNLEFIPGNLKLKN